MAFRVAAAYSAICLIWGTTWLAIKVSLVGLAPLSGAGTRFVLAGLFLYATAAITHQRTRGEKPPLRLIIVLAATMFGGNYALTYFAETHLASGLVAVLFGTLPFFVFGFGALMVHERITLRVAAGALLALGGVAVISLTGEGGGLIYVLATLGAAALSAFATVYLKRYAASDPLTTLPPAMLIAGIALFLGGALTEQHDWHAALAPSSLLAIGYLAIFGSGIAFYFNHWLLQRLPSWIVGLSALVIPVIAVIVGTFAAHEPFGQREILGAALVIAGISLALITPRRRAVAAPSELLG